MATAIGNPARGTASPVPGSAAKASRAPRVTAAHGARALRARKMRSDSVSLFVFISGFGAAILVFALSANLVTAGRHGQSPALAFAAGLIVGAWALFLLLWTIQSLRGTTPAWPAVMVRLLPAATAVQLAAVLYGLWKLPAANRSFDLTAACAVVLELVMLAALGWLRRQPARFLQPGPAAETTVAKATEPSSDALPAGRLLAVMFISAVLVAGVTTPGLAASTAGQSAVPHGSHGSHTPVLNDPAQHHH
ncbi:hypothetical protein IV498_04730 [Paenarthrobacter sp. Z7-10]|uniref:hypothetical protein n=1 Tax=Paenarthrobacter sp. Z7-10 TaxID=2787635 RepID=UPI0022A9907D|nr:hypothetical protein [Paenarthrobacter sp. Z7-10]MCZ2402503.1 hypothetical protein [Paenarthrobacter sp. Z7-10]